MKGKVVYRRGLVLLLINDTDFLAITLFTQLSRSFIQRFILLLFKMHVMLICYLLNMDK